MELKIELESDEPQVIRDISNGMVQLMPVKEEKRHNPGTLSEEREIFLVNDKVINANVDPVITMDNDLF